MPSSLKLLTCNLWSGRARPEALAEEIARFDPDVIVCQELSQRQADVVGRALPHGHLDPRNDMHGMGVATRWPVDVRRIELPRRSAHVARLDPARWPGLAQAVEVVNLHLSAPNSLRKLAERRTQIARLERYFAEQRVRRVVAGDFNSFPGMGVYDRMRAMLRDVIEEHAAASGSSPKRTWSPTAGTRRLFRIDHVMTAGLSARAAKAVRVEGSDHSALFVELTFD